MPPVGFEPTISAGERPQTYALDRATTGTGTDHALYYQITHVLTQLVLEKQIRPLKVINLFRLCWDSPCPVSRKFSLS